MPESGVPLVSEPLRRREDARLLTGAGRFVADGATGETAHLVLVRSPHAHARIEAIDTREAAAQPGVLAVATWAELEADGILPLPGGSRFGLGGGRPSPRTPRPALASERVRYVGEPVVAVIATTRLAAQAAAEAVEVGYDPLPVAGDLGAALSPEAPLVWDNAPGNVAYDWRAGDAEAVDRALAAAAHVTRLSTSVSRVSANSLEARAYRAEPEPDGRIGIHASHQNPFQLRDGLAALGFGEGRLRVHIGDVGGSFGMKGGIPQELVCCLWAVRRLGRPVLWSSDRTEAFLSDDHARELLVEAEIGFDAGGLVTGLRVKAVANLGAYASDRSGSLVINIGGVAGVYDIPCIDAAITGVLTNTVPTAAYRGAGRPEATFIIESLLDRAAAELGLSPYELRRRNLIPPSAMPYKTALTFTYDCGEFEQNMRVASDLADLANFTARRAEAERRGRLRGIGLCNCIEAAGGPAIKPARDYAKLSLMGDGAVVVDCGSVSVGQGYETTFPQIAAQRLGIARDRIRLAAADTDRLPAGRGNGGSGALCIGGVAVEAAAEALVEVARSVAAERLGAAPGEVSFSDGLFRRSGSNASIGLLELAGSDPPDAVVLEASGSFQPEAVTFPNGTHICEVEIDPDTGEVAVVGYAAVEDVGKVLNPVLLDGQVQGGIAQGIGQALGEEIVHDDAGQLVTASFMDYRMPRAADLPAFRLATREVPTRVNPIGAKGVGEAGTVGALGATMNAINDALAARGAAPVSMPATPQKVWAALQAARGAT